MRKSASRLWTVWVVTSLVTGILFAGRVQAGLIILVDPSITIDKVRDLTIDKGNLVVELATGAKKVILLPPGALENIAKWAADPVSGPMILSMDGSFVSSGKNYTPSGVTRELGEAMLYYDVFAHELALGFLPEKQQTHPLVVRRGATHLPEAQYKSLINKTNKSETALWYQRLTEHYEYPVVFPIGEFTLRAMKSDDDYPIRLEVESWLTFYPQLWYRAIFVPSAWDNMAAMLPYRPLQGDMEEHWEEYRKAFPPMDELSAVVETYALLKAVHRGDDKLWKAFRERLLPNGEAIETPEVQYTETRLRDSGWRSEKDALVGWVTLCRDSIQDQIETTQQANIALSLMGTFDWAKLEPQVAETWRNGIAKLAKTNPHLEAKLILAGCVRTDPAGDEMANSVEHFQKAAQQGPELFRLRVQGLHRLDALAPKMGDRAKAVLQAERRAVLSDYHKQVTDALSRADQDLNVWENLIQDVYSTNLIDDAKRTLSEQEFLEFMRDLASVHYHRAMAPQVGREITLIHAHFRFLRYITDVVGEKNPTDDLLGQIRIWRAELAAKMGLKEEKE